MEALQMKVFQLEWNWSFVIQELCHRGHSKEGASCLGRDRIFFRDRTSLFFMALKEEGKILPGNS